MKIELKDLFLKQKDFSMRIKNWSLPPEAHLLVEGSSGSGKTSFLHLLAGLMKPTGGEIHINSEIITSFSSEQSSRFRRTHMGIIFQKIHLLPHLTLLENTWLGAKTREQRLKAGSLIEELKLSHRINHLPRELSLGETQRAAIARALLSEPELVLADEPTASLDDKNAENVFRILKERTVGKSLIVVTHDLRARSYFTDRLQFKDILS